MLKVFCLVLLLASSVFAGGVEAKKGTYAVLKHLVTSKGEHRYSFTHSGVVNSNHKSFKELQSDIGLKGDKKEVPSNFVQHLLDNGWDLKAVSATPLVETKGSFFWAKTSYHFVKE